MLASHRILVAASISPIQGQQATIVSKENIFRKGKEDESFVKVSKQTKTQRCEHIESEVDYLFKATCNDISIVLGAITSLLSRVLKEPVEKDDKSENTMARTHAMQNNIL